MNILIIASHFNAGGISSYILNLTRGLIARGHKVYAASGGGDWIERLEAYGAKNIYLPLRTKSVISPKLLFAYFALKKIIKSEGIDIIHSQTRVSGVLASWVSRKTGVPLVSTAHGFYQRRWGRRVFPGWGRFIIAISEPVRKHLIEHFGLNPERVILVHNGIDTNRRREAEGARQKAEDREQIRKKYGLKDGPVVGIIARLSEVKGHKYLISAMAKVKEQIPDVQLLSVGDGKIRKDLERLVRGLKIDKNVYFIPAVSDTAEPLSVMDIFAMPSLQEGLGLSVMEAMLMGVAVIASSVGGIKSLIKNNETGILVEPANPQALAGGILSLLKDKEKAARLSARAGEFIIKEFSLETMAEETEAVYRKCAGQ